MKQTFFKSLVRPAILAGVVFATSIVSSEENVGADSIDIYICSGPNLDGWIADSFRVSRGLLPFDPQYHLPKTVDQSAITANIEGLKVLDHSAWSVSIPALMRELSPDNPDGFRASYKIQIGIELGLLGGLLFGDWELLQLMEPTLPSYIANYGGDTKNYVLPRTGVQLIATAHLHLASGNAGGFSDAISRLQSFFKPEQIDDLKNKIVRSGHAEPQASTLLNEELGRLAVQMASLLMMAEFELNNGKSALANEFKQNAVSRLPSPCNDGLKQFVEIVELVQRPISSNKRTS